MLSSAPVRLCQVVYSQNQFQELIPLADMSFTRRWRQCSG